MVNPALERGGGMPAFSVDGGRKRWSVVAVGVAKFLSL